MNHKCVVIIKEGLPLGFATNAAAILGVSLGKNHPEVVAEDLLDASGVKHAGLINVPIPILKTTEESLKQIYEKAQADTSINLIDFSEPARTARTFTDYKAQLEKTTQANLQYLGLALIGPKETITALTTGLPLFK